MKILWPLMFVFTAPILSYAHVVKSTNLKDGAPHWHSRPYDLKYDAKWTHLPNSKTKFNSADEVVISGRGDYSSNKPYGAQFITSNEWEEFINGHDMKVTLVVRSSTGDPIPFKVTYTTNENGQSGWYYAIANEKLTTFSFVYSVPKLTKLTKDFLIIVPGLNDIDLIITEAYLELVDE